MSCLLSLPVSRHFLHTKKGAARRTLHIIPCVPCWRGGRPPPRCLHPSHTHAMLCNPMPAEFEAGSGRTEAEPGERVADAETFVPRSKLTGLGGPTLPVSRRDNDALFLVNTGSIAVAPFELHPEWRHDTVTTWRRPRIPSPSLCKPCIRSHCHRGFFTAYGSTCCSERGGYASSIRVGLVKTHARF